MLRFFLIPALVLGLGAYEGLVAHKPASQLVLEIRPSDLPGVFSDILPEGFDLSPDGSQIAVAFETAVGHEQNSIWIAVWNISTKNLLSKVEVDGPMATAELSMPPNVREVRYMPTGDKLIVQTGPHLHLLQASDLTEILSLRPMQLPDTSRYGPSIRSFDISRDGRWLAVLTRAGRSSRTIAGVQLVEIADGKVKGEWTTRDAPAAIALSEDGSTMLLSGFDDLGNKYGDVLLVDASTGKLMKSFQSGCSRTAACGASDARFWGNDRIVTVPKPATDSHGRTLARALRIFDIDSGKLLRQLDRPEFLSIGSFTIASNAAVLMTVNAWATPGEMANDLAFHRSKPELVAFNLDNGVSKTVLHPISRGQPSNTVDQYSLRVSTNGSLVAFFQDRNVKVLRILLSFWHQGFEKDPNSGQRYCNRLLKQGNGALVRLLRPLAPEVAPFQIRVRDAKEFIHAVDR
jgi:hypothetical protein